MAPGSTKAPQVGFMIPGSPAKVAQDALAILSIVRICEKFYKFPKDGGLLDQDSLFVYILQHILMWDYQRAELDRSKQQSSMPTR